MLLRLKQAWAWLAVPCLLCPAAQADPQWLWFRTVPGSATLTEEGASRIPPRLSTPEEDLYVLQVDASKPHTYRFHRDHFDDFTAVMAWSRQMGSWTLMPGSRNDLLNANILRPYNPNAAPALATELGFSKTVHFLTSPPGAAVATTDPDTKTSVPLVVHDDGGVTVLRAFEQTELTFSLGKLFLPTQVTVGKGVLDTPSDTYPAPPAPPIQLLAMYGPFSYWQVEAGVLVLLCAGLAWVWLCSRRREPDEPVVTQPVDHNTVGADFAGQMLTSERQQAYKLVSLIGRGGAGVVYEAACLSRADQRVAVKILYQVGGEHGHRFEREIRICSALNHPGLVKVLDWGSWQQAGSEDKSRFMVMELVRGQTLKEAIAQGMSTRRLLEVMREVVVALQTAHRSGVIHRDLKPDNIIVTESGRPKVMDFGFAGRLQSHSLTGNNTALGTVHYMSPEHLRATETSPASDIYSLGVILYEGVAGRRPFQRKDFATLCLLILTEVAPPVSKWKPDVSPTLSDLIDKMMAKDPTQRMVSSAILATLDRLLSELPVA
ncbi:MAG TPA: serine/threonine-protein kinase [Candidatus Xenobia bacterium]